MVVNIPYSYGATIPVKGNEFYSMQKYADDEGLGNKSIICIILLLYFELLSMWRLFKIHNFAVRASDWPRLSEQKVKR